ncbi:hypothetical protein [Aestuariivirga sp.]|jgi:hypothetical protein|uniref:hypothetical protein n=1 Tax=Aestuariivirga sp. TaxID=2650926 RepID=UPI003783070B
MQLINDRRLQILSSLNILGAGLEVAPYFNPVLLKDECSVKYVDYVSTDELRKKAAMNPGANGREVMEVDYVWTPGRLLSSCIGSDVSFNYAVASHVVEHVPNVIGWLNEIMEVMRVGGTLALCVPDKRFSCDFYRRETEMSDLIGAWIERRSIPSPSQVYDFTSRGIYYEGNSSVLSLPFNQARRAYTDEQALSYALWTHTENQYLDVHCTVWTPDGFLASLRELNELGILNIKLSDPIVEPERAEFIIHLTKLGEPKMTLPQSSK